MNWCIRVIKSLYSKQAFAVIIVLLCILNVYQFFHASVPKNNVVHFDVEQKLNDIEGYLDGISSQYITDEQSLAAQYRISSWGCGPSSFALAKIINHKFFDDTLPIGVSYESQPNIIVERFSFAKSKDGVPVDHAWLEIYLENKMLYIDPTIGQFGRISGIAHHTFTVGDPTITQTLDNTYGLKDVRFKLLLQKAINRVPIGEEPYPGFGIGPDALTYYNVVLQDREDVAGSKTPEEWKPWVSYLTDKYK